MTIEKIPAAPKQGTIELSSLQRALGRLMKLSVDNNGRALTQAEKDLAGDCFFQYYSSQWK
jgi:hypothetical protein